MSNQAQPFIANVQLPLQYVDTILDALSEKPLKVSFDVFVAIRAQVDKQISEAQAADAARTVDTTATEVEDKAETGRVA